MGALYLTDIDDETIHVRRSITRDEVGQYLVGENAKTQSGIREIPLTPQLKRIIMDQRELNNKLFGFGWSGLIFQSAEGEILREYTVNREIKRICLEAEMSDNGSPALQFSPDNDTDDYTQVVRPRNL